MKLGGIIRVMLKTEFAFIFVQGRHISEEALPSTMYKR
jgi:hypothetical protein